MLSPDTATVDRAAPASLDAQALGYASAVLVAVQFARLAAAHGFAVHAQRLLQERAYADAQIALAHTSACAKLRASALRVFELHHG